MCMCIDRHSMQLLKFIGGAHVNVIVLVDQLWVDNMAVVSEITIEAGAFPGGVVADTLVCAVNLA